MEKTLLNLLNMILVVIGCLSCAQLSLEQIDRSRLNSTMMNFATYSDLENTAPHTALRSTGGQNNNGCSVCAH